MTTATPTTRERRAARTRQAIIDAARELITERGAHNLSLREIARRIEYSPAGLYEYFANKEEIVQAVIGDGFKRFGSYLFAVPADLPANEYVMELGLAYVRFAMQNPQHYLLIFSRPEIQMTAENSDRSVSQRTFQALTDGVDRMIDEGFLPPTIDRVAASFGNWSMVHGIAMLVVTQCQHMDVDWEEMTYRLLGQWGTGLASSAWEEHNA